METKPSAERNWIASTEETVFSDSSTKLSVSVNELYHGFDENENDVKRDCLHHNSAHGNATSPSCPAADYSIASLVPELKNLQLTQQDEHLAAGYIKVVIPPSGTLVIQRAPGSKILDVGTAIFALCDSNGNEQKNYEEIGVISDIFGSVHEPMYALQLREQVASEFLKLDSSVFYMSGHPSNRFVSVECHGNDRYIVMYS